MFFIFLFLFHCNYYFLITKIHEFQHIATRLDSKCPIDDCSAVVSIFGFVRFQMLNLGEMELIHRVAVNRYNAIVWNNLLYALAARTPFARINK